MTWGDGQVTHGHTEWQTISRSYSRAACKQPLWDNDPMRWKRWHFDWHFWLAFLTGCHELWLGDLAAIFQCFPSIMSKCCLSIFHYLCVIFWSNLGNSAHFHKMITTYTVTGRICPSFIMKVPCWLAKGAYSKVNSWLFLNFSPVVLSWAQIQISQVGRPPIFESEKTGL